MPETSKTADQALLLLLTLAESGPGTAAELAQRLGLNRTVVHRLLATLVARAFAHRDADGRYQLGTVLFGLANHVEGRLRAITVPVLESLAARFGETAVLAVADGDHAVPVEQARGSRNLMHVDYHPGIRHPLWQGAHGRAILANMAAVTISRLLETAPEPVRYGRLLDEVRDLGYAISQDELQVGVTGLAAPVFGPGRRVIASVGVVAPTPRFPPEADLADAVRRAAAEISSWLGGTQHGTQVSGRGPAAGPTTTSSTSSQP
ncbi:MAG: helix-turn-helix domain-containing protein [Streptosporangiales bacterium]|nr:helix-turn-helix domain-containing protein [Streptosporangiales bacterium]